MFSGNVGRRDGMGFWGASRSGGSVTDRVGSVTGGCQVFLTRRLVLLDGRNSAVFFPSNIWSACRQKSIEAMPRPAGIREPARRLTSKPYTCVFLPSGSAEGMLSFYHFKKSPGLCIAPSTSARKLPCTIDRAWEGGRTPRTRSISHSVNPMPPFRFSCFHHIILLPA